VKVFVHFILQHSIQKLTRQLRVDRKRQKTTLPQNTSLPPPSVEEYKKVFFISKWFEMKAGMQKMH